MLCAHPQLGFSQNETPSAPTLGTTPARLTDGVPTVRVKTLPNGNWIDQNGAMHGPSRRDNIQPPERLTDGVPTVRVKTLPNGNWIDQNGAMHGPSRRDNIQPPERLTDGVPTVRVKTLPNGNWIDQNGAMRGPSRRDSMKINSSSSPPIAVTTSSASMVPNQSLSGPWARPESTLTLAVGKRITGTEKGSQPPASKWTTTYDFALTSITTAEGPFTGTYQDQDKTIPYSGKAKIHFTGGDQLELTVNIKKADPQWKPGVAPYTSAVSAGAVLHATFKRAGK